MRTGPSECEITNCKMLTSGSKEMKSTQSPFFGDMNAAMLEPDAVSKQ